jgi:hypothetical protein
MVAAVSIPIVHLRDGEGQFGWNITRTAAAVNRRRDATNAICRLPTQR